MLSFFPRDVWDEIWDFVQAVSEGFPTYTSTYCFYLLVAVPLYIVVSSVIEIRLSIRERSYLFGSFSYTGQTTVR